jgi:hypothetical protein
MLELEDLLYRWQRIGQICIYAGKPINGPWSIRVVGVCPITRAHIAETVTGYDNDMSSAMKSLLCPSGKLGKILTGNRETILALTKE